jgi:hypothetical protein
MKNIKVTIFTQGGDQHEIETPLDIKTEDFIKELATALQLPMTDAEGHLVAWRLDNKDVGNTLTSDQTLEQNGVRDGHGFALIRQMTAGGIPGFSSQSLKQLTVNDIANSKEALMLFSHHYENLQDKYDSLEIRNETLKSELDKYKQKSQERLVATILLFVSQFIVSLGTSFFSEGNLKVAIPVLLVGVIQAILAIYLAFIPSEKSGSSTPKNSG